MRKWFCVSFGQTSRLFVLSLAALVGALIHEPGSAIAAEKITPAAALPATSSTIPDGATPAERGYHWITQKCYLPSDFDQETFDNLWKVWEQPLRDKARQATREERRKLAFSRYGLMERPGSNGHGPALGYVDDGRGGWVMNCLACHGGKVAGQVIPGLPNSHFALHTLTEDVRLTKLQQGKKLTHMDLASLKMPLGQTHGTTNSVIFGVALGAVRDKDLNVDFDRPAPKLEHHDMDAPPFWNVRKKQGLYADAFVPRGHRPLMQFMMLPSNSAKTLKSWEPDFKDVLAWIESVEVPKYPGTIDSQLAASGKLAFEKTCSRCHGTYGPGGKYPDRVIPIDDVGTDPVRLRSLTREYRKAMYDGWFGNYGQGKYVLEPEGYLAPPLDGIWASAPYLHNGSVPTLWHVLHPSARPVVWKRTEDGYDHAKVGLEVTSFDRIPSSARSSAERRSYFDTRLVGKSPAGHTYPDALTEPEKQALLEYLKGL